MGRASDRRRLRRLTADGLTDRVDTLLVEEPLEIQVPGMPSLTTMRTPGHDLDLAFGLLLTEGMLDAPDQVRTAMHCTDVGPDGSPTFNVLQLSLAEGASVRAPERTLPANSACGVCGTATIAAVRSRLGNARVPAAQVPSLDQVNAWVSGLRATQRLFEATGGAHAAGLFSGSELVVAREDVGRHNAVDKVLGWAAREHSWPLPAGTTLVVSSRASFEILTKAWAAGVSTVVCVSAASTLAVEVAQQAGITLIGMVRQGRANLYTAP